MSVPIGQSIILSILITNSNSHSPGSEKLSIPNAFYLVPALFRDLRLLNHCRQARHIIQHTTLELDLASPNLGPHFLPSSGVGRASLARNTDEFGPILAVDVFEIRIAAELFVELIRRYVGAQVLVELEFLASLGKSVRGPKTSYPSDFGQRGLPEDR